MAIRYHLDENVSGAIALALRRRGVDVTTAAESGLVGTNDFDHSDFAASQNRVIETHDGDFTRIHADGARHSGICYCSKDKHSIGDLLRLLLLVHECLTEEEMSDHLEYL
jgi:Domain of unknown function (DUF5615)